MFPFMLPPVLFSLTVGSDMQPYGPVPLPASAAFHGGISPGSIYILVQNNSLPAAQTYLEPYQEYSPDGLCPHTALEWNLKVPLCMDVHYDK